MFSTKLTRNVLTINRTITRVAISKQLCSSTTISNSYSFNNYKNNWQKNLYSLYRYKTTTKKNNDEVPEEFFDSEIEKDKEFLDVLTSFGNGGIHNLTTVKDPWTWKDVEEANDPTIASEIFNFKGEYEIHDDEMMDSDEDPLINPTNKVIYEAIATQDIEEHIESFESNLLPLEYVNSNVPWRKTDDYPEPLLENFISNTSTEKFNFDKQGDRACPGKKQRSGKNPVLKCHKIDLDELCHMDVVTLRKYLSDDAEILGKRITGLCSKCQRKVAKSIKRARHFGLLPHIGEYKIQDAAPTRDDDLFHSPVIENDFTVSRTVL